MILRRKQVTDDLFALVQRCCQLHISERIESDHMTLEFNFDFAGCVNVGEEKPDLSRFIEKVAWNDDYAQWYYNALIAQDYKKSFILLHGKLIEM